MLDYQTPNPLAPRLVAGSLVLLGLIGIVVSFGSVQRLPQVKPAAPAWSGSPPPVRTSSGWPEVPYLEVRAYYSSVPFWSFQKGVPDSVEDKDGVLLNRDQERRLISAMTAKGEPYDTYCCYNPRHAFVFYDPFGAPVAEIDICFECLVAEGGPSEAPDLGALASLVDELGLPLGEGGMEVGEYQEMFEKWRKEHRLGKWKQAQL